MASRRGGDDRGRGSLGGTPRPGGASRHAEPDESTDAGNPHDEKTRLRGPSVVDDLIASEEGGFEEKTRHGGDLLARLAAAEAAHSQTEPTVDVKLPKEDVDPLAHEAPTAFSPFETSDVVTKKSQESAAAMRKVLSRTRESVAPPIARSRESIPPPAGRNPEFVRTAEGSPPPPARGEVPPRGRASTPPPQRDESEIRTFPRSGRESTPPPRRADSEIRTYPRSGRESTPPPRGRDSIAPPLTSARKPVPMTERTVLSVPVPAKKAPGAPVQATVRAGEPLLKASDLLRQARESVPPIEATKVSLTKPARPTPDPSHARAVAAAFATGTPNNGMGPDVTPPPTAAPPHSFGGYRVVRPIGEGGMALVYEGAHATLRRSVAIKVLRPELRTKREAIERFHAEAVVLSRVSHAGVVTIYDHGFDASGAAYFVMELLRGESLATRLARDKQLPIRRAVAIASEVAAALGAVHAIGVVHRDLKPENIHLCDPGDGREQAKVLDFGVAKVRDGEGLFATAEPTRMGDLLGTPHYMSPEQMTEPSQVDPRSDVFALGCVVYEMLAGQLPFAAPVEGRRGAAPALYTLRPEVPAALDALVMRMIDARPERRPSNMGEVVEALSKIESTPAPMAVVPVLPEASSPYATPGSTSSPDLARAVAQAERAGAGWRWFVAIVLTLAVVAAAAWAWLRALE